MSRATRGPLDDFNDQRVKVYFRDERTQVEAWQNGSLQGVPGDRYAVTLCPYLNGIPADMGLPQLGIWLARVLNKASHALDLEGAPSYARMTEPKLTWEVVVGKADNG